MIRRVPSDATNSGWLTSCVVTNVASWKAIGTPSAVTCTSASITSPPRAMLCSYAYNVSSGNRPSPPPWGITSGRPIRKGLPVDDDGAVEDVGVDVAQPSSPATSETASIAAAASRNGRCPTRIAETYRARRPSCSRPRVAYPSRDVSESSVATAVPDVIHEEIDRGADCDADTQPFGGTHLQTVRVTVPTRDEQSYIAVVYKCCSLQITFILCSMPRSPTPC